MPALVAGIHVSLSARRGWPGHRRAKHAVLRTAMPGHDD